MTQPEPHVQGDAVAQLAAVGIQVTPDGLASTKCLLALRRTRRTPERRAALRRQLGIEPAPAE